MKDFSGVEGIARIEIQKRIDVIQVIIWMGFPKLLIEGKPKKLEELQNRDRITPPLSHSNFFQFIK